MDVENAFKVVGGFGRFQKFIVLSNFLLNMVLMVIVGATPKADIPNEQNMTTIVTEFDLQNMPWVVDLISSLFMAGYAFGCAIGGQISDLYGRKWIFLANYTLMHLSGIFCYFVNSWQLFAVLRTICGVCAGGSGHVLFALLVENIGKEYWGPIGVINAMFFSLGVMLISVLALTLQHWRIVCLVGSTVPLIAVPIYIVLIPESARWLYYVGKTEKAQKVLHTIARRNGRPVAGVKLCSANDCEMSKSSELKKYSILDLFRRKTLAIYALANFYIWFSCSFVYYGLTLDAAMLSPDILIANVLSGAIEWPALLITYFAIGRKRIGRKGTLVFSFVLSSMSSVGLLLAYGSKSENMSTYQTVLGLSNKLAVAGAFALLYVYGAEIFPTQLRLVALGGSSSFARFGAILSPFVPLMAPVAAYMPYIVFGVTAVLGAACTLVLPETLNKPTPEMNDFAPWNSSNSYVDFDDADSHSDIDHDRDALI